jgi:hypothetical protein
MGLRRRDRATLDAPTRKVSMALERMYRRLRFGDPIVVVSGLPRSGTSMAMRMLAAGGMPIVTDGVRAADDDNPLGYFEAERVKNLGHEHDKDWLRTARGKAIKIVSSLLEHLPESNNYAVLFLNRDLHEILASQSKMLAHRSETTDTTDERMLKLFEQHLVRIKALLRARPCFDTCELAYRDVVHDPRVAAERMQEFLGRALDQQAMAAAVDPNLYRNRRPHGAE